MNQVFASIIVSAAEMANEPRTLLGLVALLISQLASIITAIAVPVLAYLQWRAKQKLDAANAKIDAVAGRQTTNAAANLKAIAGVREGVDRTVSQVVNGHDDQPVLRVDLDEKVGGLHGAIADVKTAVLAEADTRRLADATTNERIDALAERIPKG